VNALTRTENRSRSIHTMPFGLGVWEIVILVGVLALLFGAKGVPQVARRLGTGMREVKDAVAEIDPRHMLEAGEDEKPKAATPKAATPQKPAASGDEPPAA
jgi:sec-independent protein translocase protein TatA